MSETNRFPVGGRHWEGVEASALCSDKTVPSSSTILTSMRKLFPLSGQVWYTHEMKNYILDLYEQPILSDSRTAWKWIDEQPHRKIVGLTRFPDGSQVSTVFLTLDHGWNGGPPVLWETMVFGSAGEGMYEDEWQDRYTSYKDAVAGHLAVVKDILSKNPTP